MLKKLILILALGIGCSIVGLAMGQTRAYACSNGVCGYYKGGSENANCNVLPDTSIRWGIQQRWGWDTNYGDYCWVHSDHTFGHSRLYGVRNAGGLINGVGAYLYESGSYGTAGYVNNAHAGAAFLVDDMMGIDFHNGSTGNGINDAGAQFNNWSNIVRALSNGGANECYTNSAQMTCSGKSFGINFGYKPTYFCTAPVYTSAYDPGAFDDPIYWTGGNSCDHDYWASVPEIVLFWTDNGVLKSFHIGSQCGNAQSRSDRLPTDHLPTGSFSLSCDKTTGIETAFNLSIYDQDAPTTGYLKVVGGPNPFTYNVNSGTTYNNIQIPVSDTYPYGPPVTIELHAHDTGPLGSGADYTVWSVNNGFLLPCAQVGCGITTSPTIVDPYMKFSAKVIINNGVNETPAGTLTISFSPSFGSTYTQAVPQTTGNSYTANFSALGPTKATGQYTATAKFTGGGVTTTCTTNVNVINLPYLNVYGGDVMTGAAPAVGGACSINNTAGAYSWNQNSPTYAGAGSEYAVQALAQIEEFGSGMNPSSSNPPTDLSFANSGLPAKELNPPTQGLFGGFFGDSSGAWACGVDYTKGLGSPISGAAATAQIANLAPAGTLPTQIGDGQQIRIYATGNVYIARNIAYQNGSWPKVDQIPVFELVVTGGNIYIDSSVTQLDGIYVAEPSGATGGQIIDCATNAGGIWKQVDPTVNNFYSTCNKKLTINGAFVAKQTLFGRTNGSLGQATAGDNLSSNHDAEVFNYTPEIWLPRGATTPTDTYDAITALPPIL